MIERDLLDIALAQRLLGLDAGEWILRPEETIVNRGPVCEAFGVQISRANFGALGRIRRFPLYAVSRVVEACAGAIPEERPG